LTRADHLLAAYAEHVGGLAVGPQAKRIRRRAAERLLAWHPDLTAWMARHARVIASIQRHRQPLKNQGGSTALA
jgi:hypothetical protein